MQIFTALVHFIVDSFPTIKLFEKVSIYRCAYSLAIYRNTSYRCFCITIRILKPDSCQHTPPSLIANFQSRSTQTDAVPYVGQCRRCNPSLAWGSGRKAVPPWCGTPCRWRWPWCAAEPRAVPTPPSEAEAAARSSAAPGWWAVRLGRGSTTTVSPFSEGHKWNKLCFSTVTVTCSSGLYLCSLFVWTEVLREDDGLLQNEKTRREQKHSIRTR